MVISGTNPKIYSLDLDIVRVRYTGARRGRRARAGVPPQASTGTSLSRAVDESLESSDGGADDELPVAMIASAAVGATGLFAVVLYAGIQQRKKRRKASANKVTAIASTDVEEASAHDP